MLVKLLLLFAQLGKATKVPTNLEVTIQNTRATITVTSNKKGHPVSHAFDNDQATFWQSEPRSEPTAMSIVFEEIELIKAIIIVKPVRMVKPRYKNLCVSLGVSSHFYFKFHL